MLRKQQKAVHSPTLNTVNMVEKTLQSMNESVLKISELKRRLPRQVNHDTLMRILEYLEENRKIIVSLRGITWVQNDSRKMKSELRKGSAYPEDFSV